jgi:hypothetical protein
MNIGFKVALTVITLDFGSVADPAAIYTGSFTRSDGTVVDISVAAEASRTSTGLATAVEALLPADMKAHRTAAVITAHDLGLDAPTSSAPEFSQAPSGQEFDNTLGYGVSALAGYFVGNR